MPFYRICDLSPGLDGLVVEGEKSRLLRTEGLITVSRVIKPLSIIGDRQVSLPVDREGLFIWHEHLEEVADPTGREFAHDNPYGKCLAEQVHMLGDVRVSCAKYEQGTTVTVRDESAKRTLFSHTFQNPNVMGAILDRFETTDDFDVEDLVFELQDTVKRLTANPLKKDEEEETFMDGMSLLDTHETKETD